MLWRIDDSRLVCRWAKTDGSTREIAVPADVNSTRQSKGWNSDVVFELGDAA
jgi:hypothetical protein